MPLDLSAPEEDYSRNVRASDTLKFGYTGVFKTRNVDFISGHRFQDVNNARLFYIRHDLRIIRNKISTISSMFY